MRALGILLAGGGVLGLIAALNMETTVETGGQRIGFGEYSQYVPKTRVHNIGLMEQRRTYLIVASVAVVGGVVLIGFGSVAQARGDSGPATESGPRCPRCNGVLGGKPRVCKYCRTELEWVRGSAFTPEGAELERHRLKLEREEAEKRSREQVEEWNKRTEEVRQQLVAIRDALRERISALAQAGARLPERFYGAVWKLNTEDTRILFWFLFVVVHAVIGGAIGSLIVLAFL